MPRCSSKISAGERIRGGHRYMQRFGYVGNSRDVNLVTTCTYHALTASRAAKASSVSL